MAIDFTLTEEQKNIQRTAAQIHAALDDFAGARVRSGSSQAGGRWGGSRAGHPDRFSNDEAGIRAGL